LVKSSPKKPTPTPLPTAILNPRKAISIISAVGQAFHDDEADQALFDAIHANAQCEVVDFDEEINSEVFRTSRGPQTPRTHQQVSNQVTQSSTYDQTLRRISI
jgi:hypothetical protein